MEPDSIYVLGAGAVGMSLAAHLTNRGRRVTAVRTSVDDVDAQVVQVTIHGPEGKTFKAAVETVSLARLHELAGIIVVAAKSYANQLIAARLQELTTAAPVVIMQNGVGVENPYLDVAGLRVYRCVLYLTGQNHGDNGYTFIPVMPSRVGVVRGDESELEHLVNVLNTPEFPFVTLDNIQQEVWKKATINSVFNSICTLLDTDNGIFVRDERTVRLAREVVDECILVMRRMGFSVSAEEVMQQLFAISKRSDGQLISTLQDINYGRDTEIDDLNLAIARAAETVAPDVDVTATRVLGELVKIKSTLRKKS